jgi:acyl carrier protein
MEFKTFIKNFFIRKGNIMNNILNTIIEVANNNKIKISEKNLDVSLKDLGIDSLSVMNLIIQVEEKLQKTLDDDVLVKIKTMQELVKAFEDIKN